MCGNLNIDGLEVLVNVTCSLIKTSIDGLEVLVNVTCSLLNIHRWFGGAC